MAENVQVYTKGLRDITVWTTFKSLIIQKVVVSSYFKIQKHYQFIILIIY